MKKSMVWQVVVVVLLLSAPAHLAFAMGGDYGKGNPQQPQSNPAWPVGVNELSNRENRIGGYWINGGDWFHFTGDTNAFNEFLEAYAKLRETPLTLVLHPGKGTAGAPWHKENAGAGGR